MTLNEESGIGYSQKVYLIPVSFARILHSTPYFFITLFPTAFYDRSRMTGKNIIPLKNASPLPSFLSGGQNRNDDRRKEYNLTLSEESGSGYSQKVYLIPVSSARILHFVQE